MTYDIIFPDAALKQLKKLEKSDQERIISTLERIRIRPQSYVTKLIGDTGYRLRVGDHRIILDIYEGILVVLVLKIGHRKNIYK
ncbi:MAG TPA: type II toxin-antitoxin system RelE/ParE family toxin [Methanosarcinaceae archaeon]|nr:type II toxin-antitoxin system RelE/ParE family toxin [Methanosarcinaceae archaeon]